MNIIDAVKSGKPIRRPNKGWDWAKPNKCGDCWIASNGLTTRNELSPNDILATDWEIEERKIEITEAEFDELTDNIKCIDNPMYLNINALKKRLFEK